MGYGPDQKVHMFSVIAGCFGWAHMSVDRSLHHQYCTGSISTRWQCSEPFRCNCSLNVFPTSYLRDGVQVKTVGAACSKSVFPCVSHPTAVESHFLLSVGKEEHQCHSCWFTSCSLTWQTVFSLFPWLNVFSIVMKLSSTKTSSKRALLQDIGSCIL